MAAPRSKYDHPKCHYYKVVLSMAYLLSVLLWLTKESLDVDGFFFCLARPVSRTCIPEAPKMFFWETGFPPSGCAIRTGADFQLPPAPFAPGGDDSDPFSSLK